MTVNKQLWRAQFLSKQREYSQLGPRAARSVATRGYQRRCAKSGQNADFRPRVKVLKVGTRRLFVLIVGVHYVSAYRWPNLQRKVALEQWKRIESTPTLHKRLNPA